MKPGPMSAMHRYADTATVYNVAAMQGRPPTLAAAEHFHLSHGAAAKLVQRTREAGVLPTVVGRGVSPRRNPRVVAVAEALGVDPDALASAILRHAGGGIRLVERARPACCGRPAMAGRLGARRGAAVATGCSTEPTSGG